MEQIKKLLEESANEELARIILSNPRSSNAPVKAKVRPLMLRGELYFQISRFTAAQVMHKNCTKEQLCEEAVAMMRDNFRQIEVETLHFRAVGLVSKKGRVTVRKKKNTAHVSPPALSHNRKKRYILEEGMPLGFLADLGVQTPQGAVISAKYDKFRQVNRYLELVEDIMPELPQGRPIRIIDFGCGKSYLTFALYYYMREVCKRDVHITGLDLKADVIRTCNALRDKYGYENLQFVQGDIAGFDSQEKVDMVVTLHACDTATDYALAKAVLWDAKIIFAVPCCQHELNGQIANRMLEPVLRYGILKERIAALLTDGIRANLLEQMGYDTQVVEFIDMEHTPKNILIRGVKKRAPAIERTRLREMEAALGVSPALERLLADVLVWD